MMYTKRIDTTSSKNASRHEIYQAYDLNRIVNHMFSESGFFWFISTLSQV